MQYRNSSYAERVFDTYWFEKNLQGDIVAVYDAAGTKLISYTYDAWGNCTVTYHNGGASTIAANNPFRYRGYYYDTETGFYYLNSRYYDPEIGRFINADVYVSTGQGVLSCNMFAYCVNNPVNFYDPSGESLVFMIGLSGVATWKMGVAIIGLITTTLYVAAKTIEKHPPKFPDITLPTFSSTSKSNDITGEELSDIASKYKIGQCDKAADAMKERNNNKGKIIKLSFPFAHKGLVVSDRWPTEAISYNGDHYGYLYDGIVRCNVYPEGLPEQEWIRSFHASCEIGKKIKYLG